MKIFADLNTKERNKKRFEEETTRREEEKETERERTH
jgi:hypothetical protein